MSDDNPFNVLVGDTEAEAAIFHAAARAASSEAVMDWQDPAERHRRIVQAAADTARAIREIRYSTEDAARIGREIRQSVGLE